MTHITPSYTPPMRREPLPQAVTIREPVAEDVQTGDPINYKRAEYDPPPRPPRFVKPDIEAGDGNRRRRESPRTALAPPKIADPAARVAGSRSASEPAAAPSRSPESSSWLRERASTGASACLSVAFSPCSGRLWVRR